MPKLVHGNGKHKTRGKISQALAISFEPAPKPRKSARLKLKNQQGGDGTPILVYSSLPTPSSVRLLTLLPGARDATLECTLTVARLEDSPSYETLSYEWKSQTQLYPVLCDRKYKILIRQNLRDALLRLRRRHESRVLWIDAVCIDQEDANEKTLQVGLMKRIYESAENVVAWLGKDDEKIKRAMRMICLLHRHYLPQKSGYECSEKETCCCDEDDSEKLYVGEPSREIWEAALVLNLCSYFSRLWTVQELVVARRAIFICGESNMALDCLDKFYTVIHYLWDKSPNDGFLRSVLDRNIMSIPAIRHDMRESSNADGLLDLGVILRETRDLSASDPRDKVFAVLNLASGQSASATYLDYNLNVKSVYTSAARALLEGDMCWDVFEQISIPTNRWRPPSWVPDLRDGSRRRVRIPGRRDFYAAGKTKPYLPPTGNSPSNQLRLRGVFVSVIRETQQEALDSDSHLEGKGLEMTKPFRLAMTTATKEGKYRRTGQSIQEAFLRTRLADTWLREGHLARVEMSDVGDTIPWKEASEPDSFSCHGEMAQEIVWRSTIYDFFVAEDEMMGLCPVTAMPGDTIYIVSGCRMPLVLRADRDRGVFKLVGTCYLHGYMDGEWITKLATEAQKTEKRREGNELCKYLEWWTEEAQVLKWTEEIILI